MRPHSPARRGRRAPGTADQILALLDLLYRTASAGTAWDEFLERLGGATQSQVVPFLVWDYGRRDGQCLRVFPLDATLVAEYQSWAPKNAYVRQDPRLQTGQIRVIPADAPFVRDSEFLNEWLRPRLGVGHEQLELAELASPCAGAGAVVALHPQAPHPQRASERGVLFEGRRKRRQRQPRLG